MALSEGRDGECHEIVADGLDEAAAIFVVLGQTHGLSLDDAQAMIFASCMRSIGHELHSNDGIRGVVEDAAQTADLGKLTALPDDMRRRYFTIFAQHTRLGEIVNRAFRAAGLCVETN